MYRVVSRTTALSRFNFDVVDGDIAAPGGSLSRSWASHPTTVGIVGVTAEGMIPLVRQYRAAIDGWNLELPGGRIDDTDPSPALAAVRELAEEAGAQARASTYLGSFLNSPGHCSQKTLLFIATDVLLGERRPDAGEESDSTVRLLSVDDIDTAISREEVVDAKTVIGLLLAQRRLHEPT